jgi:hypothetical protein
MIDFRGLNINNTFPLYLFPGNAMNVWVSASGESITKNRETTKGGWPS